MRATSEKLLYRRNGTYYYRQAMWAGRSFELQISLRTASYTEAKRRYAVLRSFIIIVIEDLMKKDKALTPEQIKELVHGFFIEKFAVTMDQVDFDDLRFNTDRDSVIDEAQNALQGTLEERAIGVTPPEFDQYIAYWLENYLPSASLDNHTKEAVHELLFRADIEVLEIFLKRIRNGYAGLTVQDPYFAELQQKIAHPARLIDQVQSHVLAQPTTRRKSLKDAGEEFFATKGDQSIQTVDSYRESFKILLDLVSENASVGDFDEDMAQGLLDHLKARPANLTKLLANNIDLEGRKTLSPATIAKHWIFYTQFFNWCVRKKYAAINPLADIKAPKKRASKNDRDPFSRAQIEKLFSSPLYTGFKSRRRRADQGDHICYNVDYWCPLICYYTGARPGEALQLLVSDVKQEDGIWYFDITEDMGDDGEGIAKNLKTTASRRKTPMHDALIKLGFLDYLETCKQKGVQRLFEDALPSTASGLLTDVFSKRVNHYLKRIGVHTPKTPFYSLRHTFAQAMREGNVMENIASELMGHEAKGITYGVYSGRLNLKTLHENLHKGAFPIDAHEMITQLTINKTLKEVAA